MTKLSTAVTLACIALFAHPALANDALGKWTTFDDETNEAKSVIEVYEEGATLSARIVSVLKKEEPNPKCGACKDELKDQPIEGLRIVWDMKADGEEWKGGRILDPDNGKIYKAKMSLDEDEDEDGAVLLVRGSLGPFGRTQVWRRRDE